MEASFSQLGLGEARVWMAFPEEITSPELLARYERLLDAEERARYQRFVFDQHRKEYLIAHALLRRSLSQCAPVAPEAWRFTRNVYGRPEIADGIGPSRLRFNLSHTRGLSACAVTQEFDIGIDVEWQNRQVDPAELAPLVFSPEERRSLLDLPAPEQWQRFFDLWTLKEAYIKACGKGLAQPLDQFTFAVSNRAEVRVAFHPPLVDDPSAWQFCLLTPTSEHRLATAIRCGSGVELRWSIERMTP